MILDIDNVKLRDIVEIPTYDLIVERFGKNLDGNQTNTNYGIRKAGEMHDMCGGKHKVIGIDAKAIQFENTTGNTWWFSKDVFTIDIEPEVKDNKKTYVGKHKAIYINEIIEKQISHRYELVQKEYLWDIHKKHGIIDTIYPYEKTRANKKNRENLKTGNNGQYAISERVSKEMNVPQLKIDDLITLLGYTKKNIEEILYNLKDKQIRLVVIGYGGTGTNFLHWTSQLSLLSEIKNIFFEIILSDDDYFDTVNLFRVPFILPELNKTYLSKKVLYWKDYAKISHYRTLMPENITEHNFYEDAVYYGAPDLETRKMLHKKGLAFIAATHRNEECGLTLRPNIDTELMVETYGKIGLTSFFLNHLKMTIEFLKFLGNNETTDEVLTGDEKVILKYNFSEENNSMIHDGLAVNGKFLAPVVPMPDNRTTL